MTLGLGSAPQSVFLRFNSVSIPDNATIISAKVQLKAYDNRAVNSVHLNIYVEDADSPTAPTSYSDNMGRPLTAAVAWNSVGAWTTDTWYDTPDITTIVQAAVDRAGWAENNAMTIHIRDNGSDTSAMRLSKDRHIGASESAKLVVTYTL